MTQKRFAILDRDGTVIVERNYLSDPAQVELIPGAAQGLRELRELGFGLLVVTNQSGIGRGYFNETRLAEVHQKLRELLAGEGIGLDGIYYCPHVPEDDCRCRKPETRLLEIAAADHSFDPGQSFVIGDKPCDVELGRNIGAPTILVRTGYGQEIAAKKLANPDYVAKDLCDAARIIRELLSSYGREVSQGDPVLSV